MPVTEMPDRDRHRFCMRCHRWHEPDEGDTVRWEATGPWIALWQLKKEVTDPDSAPAFMCHRCQRIRRLTKIVVFGAGVFVLVIVLLLAKTPV